MKCLELVADLEKLAVKDILGSIGKMWILCVWRKAFTVMEKWKLLAEKKTGYKTGYVCKQYENIFVNKICVNT